MIPQEHAQTDYDVAIVGAGPVGLVLGIQLAQGGHSVVLLEQWPAPYGLPRAVHFDHEVGRILQSCGIGDQLRGVTEPAEVYEWRNGEGTTLLRFGRKGTAASGWPFSSMFNQPQLEALLVERADSLPSLELRRGTRVCAVEQCGDHVVIGYVPMGDGAQREVIAEPPHASRLTARYVVGCDGANSTIRSLLDVPMDDRGFFYDWLIVDVLLDEPRVFDPPNLQICDPERPTTAVSGGPGRRRWEFMRLPQERIEDLNHEARAWELLAPWDVHPGNARLERHAVYTFQARVAPRWHQGRVFLAGDAAHQMPPFAGQGMCAGIRDAANLAWKIDLVLRGCAAPGLLASYEEERRPSVSLAVDFSIELGKVICVADPTEAAARDDAMSSAYDGGTSNAPSLPGIDDGVVHRDAPLAGELFPQGEVGGALFDDIYGAGWRLVTVDTDRSIDPSLCEWFGSIGGVVFDAAGNSEDLSGWFEANHLRWALQRPDFYLYGAACDVAGASELLIALRQQLGSTPG